jgi:hypothetical protein
MTMDVLVVNGIGHDSGRSTSSRRPAARRIKLIYANAEVALIRSRPTARRS